MDTEVEAAIEKLEARIEYLEERERLMAGTRAGESARQRRRDGEMDLWLVHLDDDDGGEATLLFDLRDGYRGEGQYHIVSAETEAWAVSKAQARRASA
jgi:hypothetical protein